MVYLEERAPVDLPLALPAIALRGADLVNERFYRHQNSLITHVTVGVSYYSNSNTLTHHKQSSRSTFQPLKGSGKHS
jgi:hypothetical protein